MEGKEWMQFVQWVIGIIIVFVVAWNTRLQNTISKIKTSIASNEKNIALNTQKDNDVIKRLDAMDDKLKDILETVGDLKVDLAREQGKNS